MTQEKFPDKTKFAGVSSGISKGRHASCVLSRSGATGIATLVFTLKQASALFLQWELVAEKKENGGSWKAEWSGEKVTRLPESVFRQYHGFSKKKKKIINQGFQRIFIEQ